MVKRMKVVRMEAIMFPLMFIGISIMTLKTSGYLGEDKELKSMEDYVVSSSSTEADGSYPFFLGLDTGVQTQQDFKSCLLSEARTIGLVVDKKYGDDSIADLRSIYESIDAAFKKTQKSQGLAESGMGFKDFDDHEALNDHVTSKDYMSNALCFALAWDEYDTSNPDEPVYSLEILTKL